MMAIIEEENQITELPDQYENGNNSVFEKNLDLMEIMLSQHIIFQSYLRGAIQAVYF